MDADASGGSGAPEDDTGPPARPLDAPRDGVPDLVETPARLADAVAAIAAGTGPVAVDAERASGYRYGQRAFLVQLRRAGAGTVLVDPVPLPDLSTLARALGGTEWVVHAASQDLPCLAELGMRPGGELFDTELAARLAGFDKVGLASIVERLLGWQLAKEHSAVDWSTRPLPEPWLSYAALDVEVLVELRDALDAELASQGKAEWARQEFAAVRDTPPAPPRQDPWRRTSGLHAVRSRRQLAALRELWTEREEMARRRDIAPGRVLPDRALVSASVAMPTSAEDLAKLPIFSGPANRRIADRWLGALARARKLLDDELPPHALPGDGPPPPRLWKDRDPAAAERLKVARAAVTALAVEHRVPVENLLTPDSLRRLCWTPPETMDEASVAEVLGALGARAWQVDLVTAPLVAAITADPTAE
ncbi:MAG TPA: ribonuclease D [Actinomycetales bacterium]|nr:ribonuclease D [Actinomycetales bacterium]